MSKHTFPIAALLLAVALSISGCQTERMYSGPELPRHQVAVIKRAGPIFLAVDGKRTGVLVAELEVKPGKHTVALNLMRCSFYPVVTSTGIMPMSNCQGTPLEVLSFDAEAGHSYVVHGRFASGGPAYWVVDEQTKRLVAGAKPGRTVGTPPTTMR